MIPALNEEAYLPDTLRAVAQSAALLRSRAGVETEMIVVDNGSTDATAAVARFSGARVMEEPERNIGRARNRGAGAATGEALVFLDADTRIPEELLFRIHQALTIPGCVGGAVDTDWRPRKWSVRVYLALWRIAGKAAGMAQGATQFCSRQTFDTLGGYDEALLMGEDVDFYWRMRRHARSVAGHVRLIDEVRVAPSCRRFDQWPLWRTLVWTNPVVILPMRRARFMWRGWYDRPVR